MASPEIRTFRQITKDRLLGEMLRDIRGPNSSSADWKVLIMDDFTLKVMSASCKMADVTEEGISLVEDLNKRRQPLPQLEGVYFIQPTPASVKRFVEDMQGRSPLYKRAYVFFSSPVRKELLQLIKDDATLRPRIAALKEVNLEYLTVDMQGFVTEQGSALGQLFGDAIDDSSMDYERAIDSIASRLATVFASLKEFPAVRYRAARSSGAATAQGARARDLVSTKVASALWDRIMKYRQGLPNYPARDSCDLLIVDRSVDVVAPIIHDWSYSGMCFDLLPMDGNKYQYNVSTHAGKQEEKTVLLDEHDPIWLDLRDLFIAEAYERVQAVSAELAAKSMSDRPGELSAKEMSQLIKSLPQYREQKDKVELHINIATSLNQKLNAEGLSDIGKLEQGFVFDDAKTLYKDLANLLSSMHDMSSENKLRLLLVYAATHPDKFDAPKRLYWQKLTIADMGAITNLELLGVPIGKKGSEAVAAAPAAAEKKSFLSSFSSVRKEKQAGVRKDRHAVEGAWELSRFYPLLQDVVEDMATGVLSRDLYPYIEEPSDDNVLRGGGRAATSVRGGSASSSSASGSTWASRSSKPADSVGDGHRRTLSASNVNIRGRRLFVFVVGGMTRSEIRAVHALTAQLNREVVIGSTSVDSPNVFLEKLKNLSYRHDS
eukprot:jgi/Mesen1/3226/ME000187S02389